MRIYFKIIIFIISALILTNCTEKISYSGKIFNKNKDINNFNTKKEVINYLGSPNYIDPIEKKYFYYSETTKSKNFFDKKIMDRKLIIFHFNSNDTIISMNEYNLDNLNQIHLIKDQTSNKIIKQGLLEKIFGGVGRGPTESTTP